jgi:hypothetical protein
MLLGILKTPKGTLQSPAMGGADKQNCCRLGSAWADIDRVP